MRCLVVWLGACGFGNAVTPSQPIDAEMDGVVDAAIDAAPGSEPTVVQPFCGTDAALHACFAFDNNTNDGSTYNNDATSSVVATYVPGRTTQNGQALVTATGTFTVAGTTSLNMTGFTIKMWIRPTTIPTGGLRAGLVDSGGRFRVFLQSDGAIRCAITNGTDLTTGTGVIPAAEWHRVTCVFTGTVMRIYKDGQMVAMSNTASTIPTTTTGMVIGHNNPNSENFDGAIDELEIWSATNIAP